MAKAENLEVAIKWPVVRLELLASNEMGGSPHKVLNVPPQSVPRVGDEVQAWDDGPCLQVQHVAWSHDLTACTVVLRGRVLTSAGLGRLQLGPGWSPTRVCDDG